MCYLVCGMVHIKEPLLLIGKSSPCGGSGFPLSLSEWPFTICPTPYVESSDIYTVYPHILVQSHTHTHTHKHTHTHIHTHTLSTELKL